jgi:putative ABC transport system permease protein
VLNDLRFAFRSLRKSPGFTAVAAITLALGIGANTAIFSVVDAVLLKPLPYPHADRLISLGTKMSEPFAVRGMAMSYPDIKQLQGLTKDFAGVAAYSETRYNYAGRDQARELAVTAVTPGLFGVLGVSPAMGRGFTEAELHDQLAVLSYGMWATEFGSDRNLVGRVINLDGRNFTVVGVMPRGFAFPNEDTQLWVPLGEALRSDPQLEFNRRFFAFATVARLAPGATLAQARADVDLVAQRIGAAERDQPGGGERRIAVNMRSAGPGRGPGGGPKVATAAGTAFGADLLTVPGVENVRPALLVLFGAVGLVLLIACANAAGLYVARATERRKEIAVRRALGANRTRLARQLLTESVVLALIAGAAGVLLARWGLSAVLAVWPRVPRADAVGIDGSVLGFALGVSIFTGLAFGLLPALRAAAPGVEEALRDEGGATTGSRRRHRTQSGLVVVEIALALVLLVGAGLLIRSFVGLTSVDPGYDTHDVLAARIRLTPSRYADPTAQEQFFQNLTDLLSRNPGVADVSLSRTLPLTGGVDIIAFDPRKIRPEATQEFLAARLSVVGPDYFAAMGIALRGRDFTPQDRADAPKVVIMSRRLTDQLWPRQDPVGKIFPVRGPGASGYDATVIGTIGDIRYASLDATPMPELYLPELQTSGGPGGPSQMWIVLKAKRSPLALAGAVRDAVRQLDPQQPIGDLVSLAQALSHSTAARRLSMTLLTLFAALAVRLALIGIYGITAYAVTQRTRELGLRMAVGARPTEVVGLLLKESLWLVAGGVVLGTAGAALATRALRTMLFGVSTLDAVTFVGAALVLGAVAMLATYVPARRASRIDPMEALRYE